MKKYKEFIQENIIWDDEEKRFFDMDEMRYLSDKDLKYINISDMEEIDDDDDYDYYRDIQYEEKDIRFEVLRGKDVLRSFNYYNEINTNRMEFSCCNFNMRKGFQNKIRKEWFDFYVKNPDTCGAITMFEDDEICGRASFFEGTNLVDNYDVKKGTYYKFFNIPYLYRGKRYEEELRKWTIENDYTYILDTRGLIFIPFNTRVVTQYPPVDIVTVNVYENILCSGDPNQKNKVGFNRYYIPTINPKNFHGAYKLNLNYL